MASVVLFIVSLVTAAELTIELYTTSAAPFSLGSVISSVQATTGLAGNIRVHQLSHHTEVSEIEGEHVLDYTYDSQISAKLEAEMEGQGYLAMWEREENQGDQGYEKEFSEVMKGLGFTGVKIISNSETKNVQKGRSMLREHPEVYRDMSIIPESADLSFCLDFVGRMIKPRGINTLAIFTDELAALRLLTALEAKKMNRAGYAFFLSQQAAGYRYLDEPKVGLLSSGVLFVDEACAIAPSRIDFEVCRLSKQLQYIQSSGGQFLAPVWSLLALNNSRAQTVNLLSHTNLLFPGNTTAVPNLSKAKIRASVNYDLTNPDGSVYPVTRTLMRGFEVAFKEANNRTDLIPDYFLEDYHVTYAGLAFDYNVSLKRVLADKKNLGLAYFCGPATVSLVGMMKVFADLNVSMPVTGGSIASLLSDPKTFPMYYRPRVGNTYMVSIISRLISFFGWTRVAALCATDSSDHEDFYNRFLLVSKEFNINITNPEEWRKLPPVLNNDTAALVNQTLGHIINSDTRIILMLHWYHYVIMDQLYDLGAREGYVILLVTGLSDAYFAGPANYKRRVVGKGALMFFPSTFVGKVGQRVLDQLTAIDKVGVIPNSCFFYDVANLYFHATDFLLEKGLDYEDPWLIMKTLRETYFHGCAGFFKIESGTNDKVASEIALTNLQYFSDNDTYALKVVGAYNPYSAQPYQITSRIQWPDDGDTYADVKPKFGDCPFLEEAVRMMNDGHVIAMVVNFSMAVISLMVSALIWKKWWRVPEEFLTEKQPITAEDVLALSTIVCDFFQFAAVGPELVYISHFLSSIVAGFGFDTEKLFKIISGVYWIVLDSVLGMVVVWTLLFFVKFSRIDLVIHKLCNILDYWIELLMPTLGNLLFLPIVSTLTNVFICYKGISDELTDSFMDKDCYEFCWRDKHLGYAIGSGMALLCYIPLAIFTRPLWQELQRNVHVKARPLALMVKSAVQIFLIVASNTLKLHFPSVQAGIFIGTVGLYIGFMLKVRQFNYDRLNLWQILAMFAVLVLAVVGYLADSSNAKELSLWLIIVAIAFALLGAVGVLLQCSVSRFESKLKREKSRDVRGLFTFAFTSGVRAKAGLEQFYTANSISANRSRKSSVSEQ